MERVIRFDSLPSRVTLKGLKAELEKLGITSVKTLKYAGPKAYVVTLAPDDAAVIDSTTVRQAETRRQFCHTSNFSKD